MRPLRWEYVRPDGVVLYSSLWTDEISPVMAPWVWGPIDDDEWADLLATLPSCLLRPAT